MAMPRPVRLFHITAIDNLDMICQQGALLSKVRNKQLGLHYHNIAHGGAQGARAVKSVINPPGGLVHEFVPFYFAPRSPMLSAIHHGQVQNCQYDQTGIIYFETTVERARQSGLQEFVFYDRNATLDYSQCFTNLNLLGSSVDWATMIASPQLDGFCKYFFDNPRDDRYVDRMEKRQAEFLIKERVPLNWMTRIGVIDEVRAQEVNAILARNNVNLTVDVMTDWYFLGQ
ncbi:DUF4433 domain-containing protein [Marinomonas mediterranea]|uniref:type II toxin-antitoxin system toxin DNA ADP-ribosyl transferase DarT n=1 Tax=Marinomonas mediterranea TaxID=119864 RepID=UPI00234BF212|nr:DUF4433 domain-containing protein [Marinomonas mediterranea]WCN08261.1 DUF4433 domain-containing protein [Marinomonas mediterranea]